MKKFGLFSILMAVLTLLIASQAQAGPEQMGWLMMGGGFAIMAYARRRRRASLHFH